MLGPAQPALGAVLGKVGRIDAPGHDVGEIGRLPFFPVERNLALDPIVRREGDALGVLDDRLRMERFQNALVVDRHGNRQRV